MQPLQNTLLLSRAFSHHARIAALAKAARWGRADTSLPLEVVFSNAAPAPETKAEGKITEDEVRTFCSSGEFVDADLPSTSHLKQWPSCQVAHTAHTAFHPLNPIT
eukprot:IDg3927t1